MSYLIKIPDQLLLLFSLTIFFGCGAKDNSPLQFVYSVDKEGVYIYSLKDETSGIIYSTDKVFLNDYFTFINDSILQVAHQSKIYSEKRKRKVYSSYFYRADGDSTFITDNPPYTLEDTYDFLTYSVFYINIKTNIHYLAKVLDYEHYEHSNLKIKTRTFNEKGILTSEKDTSFKCGQSSSSSKGIKYCNFTRFYEQSETIQGKTISSERGNLILTTKDSATILLKYDGRFDPKFGSGYYNPTLSNDGKKVAFQYLAGFLEKGTCIYEMDLATLTKTELIGEGYGNPKYSPDDQLLLLFSNNRSVTINNTWINDIYVFDIPGKNKTKVAEGENYLWVPKKRCGFFQAIVDLSVTNFIVD